MDKTNLPPLPEPNMHDPALGDYFDAEQMHEYAARAVREAVPDEAKALAAFTEYFVRNYPGPHTIIGDPNWHAPRIFRAAKYALAAAPAQDQENGS